MSYYQNHVTIKTAHVEEALEWAKQNCPSYITNNYHMDGYNTYDINLIDFFFLANEQGKKEMTMFALKWIK